MSGRALLRGRASLPGNLTFDTVAACAARLSATAVRIARGLFTAPPLAAILALALSSCDVENVKPDVEVRTITVRVPTPVPVPCFTEADRPVMPPPTFTTQAQIDAASPEQLAAADRADRLALEVYTAKVDALYVACLNSSPKGPAP